MCPRGRPRGQGRPRGLHLWSIKNILNKYDHGEKKKSVFVSIYSVRVNMCFRQ